MSLWIIEYTYDRRENVRQSLRDDHSSYLRGLADAGAMIGYGKCDDTKTGPKALWLASAPTRNHAEDLVSGDPYVLVGSVIDIRIRPWDAHFTTPWQGEDGTADRY